MQKAITIVLLVSLVGCSPLRHRRSDTTAPLEPEFQFDGAYTIAIEGTPDDLDRLAPRGSWNPRVLFDTGIGGACASIPPEPSAASRTIRRWLVYDGPARAGGSRARAAPAGTHGWSVAYAAAKLHDRGRAAAGSGVSVEALELATVLDALDRPPVRVVALEPSVRYVDARLADTLIAIAERTGFDHCTASPSTRAGCTLEVCRGPSVHWPSRPDFAWHLANDRSQLASARQATGNAPGKGITIAHLDTGYPGPPDSEGCDVPRSFDEAASCDFVSHGTCAPNATDPCRPLPLSQCGHGTGTLGLLAGGRMQVAKPPFDDDLGGAPDTRIVEYRISDYVVHPYPVVMAAAIDTASHTAQAVDVISMSMGGLPAGALRDAVNNAYCRGVALFAAAGNYVVIPPFSSPRHVVYPAAFSRVVAVTGATATERSYALVPGWASLLETCDWTYWFMRGNYGPPASMGAALAAYTANVPFLRHWKKADGFRDRVDLDGTGTSSATPQVAAAAALWLQMHRAVIEADGAWRSWHKPEAVYHALFVKAAKNTPSGRYSRRYFGQGLLRARDALTVDFDATLPERPPARIDWIAVARFLFSGLCRGGARRPDACLLSETMLGTELAQTVARSAGVQRALELAAVAPMELAVDPFPHRDLWRAIAAVPGTTRSLRAALAASVLATPTGKR